MTVHQYDPKKVTVTIGGHTFKFEDEDDEMQFVQRSVPSRLWARMVSGFRPVRTVCSKFLGLAKEENELDAHEDVPQAYWEARERVFRGVRTKK